MLQHHHPAGATGQDAAKAFTTLQARFALVGWALDPAADGTLLASRWGRARDLPDMEAAERFLAMLEGRCE
ncbi:MAG: hypothetical protein KBC73_13195 [Burkholderiaceae bacterium]|nr:hypothetical protein [Burkholderiaceae bacterium]